MSAQFLFWFPCRADEGPGGSPHCEAMARGGAASYLLRSLKIG